MRVLLCGHRSFAAKGLIDRLRADGHDVTAFNRGPLAVREPDQAGTSDESAVRVVTGPVMEIDTNPHLAGPFDVVVNYVLLKDEPIAPNVDFIDALLRQCQRCGAGHLVHISSISSYKGNAPLVTEDVEIETVPEKKGGYGSLKVATDLRLLERQPANLRLSLIRPGFILGPGLGNPIVGTAARLPWNEVLIIGTHKRVIPMTSRPLVNECIARVIGDPPSAQREAVILVSKNSPTRRGFVEACCRRLGIGTRVRSLPVPLWWCIAAGAEVTARLLGQGKMQPYQKLVSRLSRQGYDSSRSAARLKMDLTVDWEKELAGSGDAQDTNFVVPPAPPAGFPVSSGSVAFIGFGRIVRQKHIPGLRKSSFNGTVDALDLKPAVVDGVNVRAVAGASLGKPELAIVASPGFAHAAALPLLKDYDGTVVVEKPLCYNAAELVAWQDYARSRTAPVVVCHNYRFKQNVTRMLDHLRRFNPGRLHRVSVEFQSPSVMGDSAAWLRQERKSRTLLMDYAIHFLDMACMFSSDPWTVVDTRYDLDVHGHTRRIIGRLDGSYGVDFSIAQGNSPRRCRLRYEFQNYVASLAFFPDTFVPIMSDDNPWHHRAEARDSRKQLVRKIADKLLNKDADRSHAKLLGCSLHASKDAGARAAIDMVTVERVANFYRAIFEVAERVYGTESR